MSIVKHPEQRVGVFIDTQNLYHSAKNIYHARVNFGKVLKEAVGPRKLIRAIAYVIRTESGEEKQFFEALQQQGIEIKAKVILDTLESETASLGQDQQKKLFEEVMEDYSHIKTKRKRIAAVREDKYFNALQIKFASAITCHKSQGGQWSAVFIDNPFWSSEVTVDDLKWLYTAATRATRRLYFVNFDNKFFKVKTKNI